jgi:hypothetical protein
VGYWCLSLKNRTGKIQHMKKAPLWHLVTKMFVWSLNLVNTVVQETIDRERMQQLEADLAELRAKYPQNGVDDPNEVGENQR